MARAKVKMEKKAAPGEEIHIVHAAGKPKELVSARNAMEAARRYLAKHDTADGGWVFVRQGEGREQRFTFKKPRRYGK